MRSLIAGTEQIFKWALSDRPPLHTWTRGRATLLGDAGEMVQLTDPREVNARNARLQASPGAPIDRFDWIWNYDVDRATADE